MYNSINSDLLRGNTDTIILKALASGDRYGYDICREIERMSLGQYQLKQPTLYSSLRRLENQGFISFYWGENTNGGRRKYYKLTEQGKSLFLKNQTEWELSRTIIDRLISDKTFDLSALPPLDPNFVRENEDDVFAVNADDDFSPSQRPYIDDNAIDSSAEDSIKASETTGASEAAGFSDTAEAEVSLTTQNNNDIEPSSAPSNNDTNTFSQPDTIVKANDEGLASFTSSLSSLKRGFDTSSAAPIDVEFKEFTSKLSSFSSLKSYSETASEVKEREDFSNLSRKFEELSRQINQQAELENQSPPPSKPSRPEPLSRVRDERVATASERRATINTIEYKSILNKLFKNGKDVSQEEDAILTEDTAYDAVSDSAQDLSSREDAGQTYREPIVEKIAEKIFEDRGGGSADAVEEDVKYDEPNFQFYKEEDFDGSFFDEEQIRYREFGKSEEAFINVNPDDYTVNPRSDFHIKNHSRNQNKEFETQHYVLGNKLRFHAATIICVLMAVEVSSMLIWFSNRNMNNITNSWIYVLAYLAPFFILSASFAAYRFNPDRKTRSTYSLFNNFVFHSILFVMLSMLAILINILSGMTIYNAADYIVTMIVPIVVTSNFVLYSVMYFILLKSRKYAA